MKCSPRGSCGGAQYLARYPARPYRGIAATGKPVAYKGIVIFRLENSKIIERWAVIDWVFSNGLVAYPIRRSGESMSLRRFACTVDVLRHSQGAAKQRREHNSLHIPTPCVDINGICVIGVRCGSWTREYFRRLC